MVLDQELWFSLQVFSVIDEILTCDDAHQILDNISLRWFSEGLGDMGLGGRHGWLGCLLCHLLAVQSWKNLFNSVNFSFPFYEKNKITSPLRDCCGDYMN